MTLLLEDFEITAPRYAAPSETVPAAQVEVDKAAAYEQGYKAGWDDSTRAEARDQNRIGADFARNLQELSFTFHEARAHVIQAMEPLLNELVGTLLPDLVCETMGQKIVEELRPMVEAHADQPVQLVVAPGSRPALEIQLAQSSIATVELTEEPSLAEGQAYLRIGKTEKHIDMTGALERILAAVKSLCALNERTLKHG